MSKGKSGGTRYSNVRNRNSRTYMRWMPYEAAKMTVQMAGIRSREHYLKWHKDNNPYYIPSRPHRVYKEEWTSWNDFLGNDNTFLGNVKRGDWLPYWEAARIVQSYKFKTKREYLENHDKIEGNIPKAANVAYKDDWRGWPAFLGVDAASIVEVARHTVGIVALCVSELLPSNVVEAIIAPEGKKQLLEKLGERSHLRVLKAWVWESELWPQVKNVLETMATESDPGVYTVPNMPALLYEIDNILLIYRDDRT